MASERVLTDSIFETPVSLNPRKRLHTPGSVADFRSHKKRRMSMASVDLSAELGSASPIHFGSKNASISTYDRFITLRPKASIPLTISPRTNRMCKQFGLLNDQRLSYREDAYPSSSRSNENAFQLLRKSASTLFNTPKPVNCASVTQNLAKIPHHTLALDSPGMTQDPLGTPISWSLRNQIAVALGRNVFYQNLETKSVAHLFQSRLRYEDDPRGKDVLSIAWGDRQHETFLASANRDGLVEVWDAGDTSGSLGRRVHNPYAANSKAKSLCWNGDVLAFGDEGGGISVVDVREKTLAGGRRYVHHRKAVIGLQWSLDGTFLASGDLQGTVHIWDRRACKSFLEPGQHSRKMKHNGAVKALTWCPWKPDLLATGSHYPEGKIRIWSASSMSSRTFEPVETYSVDSSVYSLIWSPHCQELLSTHGVAFQPLAPAVQRRRTIFGPAAAGTTVAPPPLPTFVRSHFTNSIVVHDYPSGKCLLRLSGASQHPITASCLGPDGLSVFTASPEEEAIKMWEVWGQPKEVEAVSAFEKCIIR